jgi:hypothetical protein
MNKTQKNAALALGCNRSVQIKFIIDKIHTQ